MLIALLLAGMAFALSQTVVSPALPEIQREYASAAATAWILTGYLLAASVATPIVGKLGDLFGRGRVLTMVLLVFAAGSAVCALAAVARRARRRPRHPGRRRRHLPARVRDHPRDVPARAGATAIGGISATFGIGGGVGLVIAA